METNNQRLFDGAYSPILTLKREVSAFRKIRVLQSLLTLSLLAAPSYLCALGPAPVDLRSASSFTILAGAGITTTGGGSIGGDVGASPITGAAIALTDAQVDGTIYSVDAAGPPGSVIDPALLLKAKGDLTTAYNYAANLTPIPSGPFLNPGAGNIGGMALVPGLYKFTGTALITGADVTLVGGPNDVWIFQIAADLQLGSGIKVILAGGAQPRNIFWQVGTSAVLGTFSVFKGTILADQAITMNTSSTMDGRALAFEAGVVYNGSSGNLPGNPYADYGDAPDDASHRFPTEDFTSSSRAMGRGVHHFSVGQEYFGTTVTAEAGPLDLNDPDGLPNLVNNDSDDGLLGISFTPIGGASTPFSGTASETNMMHATVAVALAADATAGPRYVNILLDTNRDQEWKNTHEGQEWVVSNYRVDVVPGTSQTITLALENITINPPPRNADMWMRMTVTDRAITKSDYKALGGWDGSGAFIHGETEDYLLFAANAPNTCLVSAPPAPSCASNFKVRLNTPTLVLNQNQTGLVDVVIAVDGVGAYAVMESIVAEPFDAPIAGAGISNTILPGEVGTVSPALNTPLNAGTNHVQIPVGPFDLSSSGITQSFGISFTVSGYDCTGKKAFGSTNSAGIIVIHPQGGVTVRSATIPYGPTALHAVGVPVALQPVSGSPIGYVKFGTQQLTSGTIYAVQVNDYPPGLPVDKRPGIVPLTTYFQTFSEVQPASVSFERQTQITGIEITGYSPGDLSAAGITDESLVKAVRYSTTPQSYFDVWQERSAAGVSTSVNTSTHTVSVENPFGFSYFGIGVDSLPSSAAENWQLY